MDTFVRATGACSRVHVIRGGLGGSRSESWSWRRSTRVNKGLKECSRTRQTHKVGVNRSLRAEKAVSALYAELSGYHGSTEKGQISTKPLSALRGCMSSCNLFGREKTIIPFQEEIKRSHEQARLSSTHGTLRDSNKSYICIFLFLLMFFFVPLTGEIIFRKPGVKRRRSSAHF